MSEVDTVMIGSHNHGIEFGPVTLSDSNDPYAGDSFMARLVSDGLSATRIVFMFRHDWETLAGFFVDLAKAWKGFEGQRDYRTVEHDFEICVTSDASGHNHFTFVLRDGPTSTWSAYVDSIEIPAGQDTATLAENVTKWAQVRA